LKTAGMPTGKIFGIIKSEYNPGFDVENLDIKKENTYAKRMHKLKVIDEVVNVVYQNNGKRAMSVGAGSPRKNARESLKLKGLDEYIKILVSKDDVQQHKPHPEIFLKCAELMGADPGNCHVFEYGDLGIQTAKSRGMHVTDSRKHLNQTI
jgi:HAD superfamily hydrolase (TIGR01509 family)